MNSSCCDFYHINGYCTSYTRINMFCALSQNYLEMSYHCKLRCLQLEICINLHYPIQLIIIFDIFFACIQGFPWIEADNELTSLPDAKMIPLKTMSSHLIKVRVVLVMFLS